MLRDVLFALIESAPDIEIVGEGSSLDGVAEVVRRAQADVLLLGVQHPLSRHHVCELLAAHEGLRMLTVTRNGRDVRACEFSCRAVEPSPRAVLEEVRRVRPRPDAD